MPKFDWDRYGNEILKILDAAGGDKQRAAAAVSRQFGIPVSRHAVRRFLKRFRASSKELVEEAASAASVTPAFARFANPPGVARSDQEPLGDLKLKQGIDTSWDPRPEVVPISYPKEGRVLIASDVHFPYENKPALRIFLQYARHLKSKLGWLKLILNGDIYDFFAISDFDRDPDRASHTLQREFNAGRAFIEECCEIFDEVTVNVGNHCFRWYKTTCAHPGLYGLHATKLSSLAGFPAKIQVYPYLTILKMGRLHVTHGFFASQNTAKTTYNRFQCSMVVGHDHTAGLHVNVNSLTQESHVVAVAGTLSDVSQAAWAKHPRWTTSFIDVEMWTTNDGKPAFNLHHRLIVDNSLMADGKVFRG